MLTKPFSCIYIYIYNGINAEKYIYIIIYLHINLTVNLENVTIQ